MIIREKRKYTIKNQKLTMRFLHGERFYDWFDKTFGIPSLNVSIQNRSCESIYAETIKKILPDNHGSPPDITEK